MLNNENNTFIEIKKISNILDQKWELSAFFTDRTYRRGISAWPDRQTKADSPDDGFSSLLRNHNKHNTFIIT